MRSTSDGNNLINTITSLTPALVQIFAFFVEDFSTKFQLSKFLLVPELLTFINFVVLLLSLAGIAIFNYWKQYNIFILQGYVRSNRPGATTTEENIPVLQRHIFITQIVLFGIIIIFSTIFICIILNNKALSHSPFQIWAIIQWFSYIVFLTSISLALYIWIDDMKTRQTFLESQSLYIPRVLESLLDAGWVSSPKIIGFADVQPGLTKRVVLQLDERAGAKYLDILTSIDGKEIQYVSESSTNPASNPNQSANQ